MKFNREKWKQIWETKPQPKHHNTEDFMYYDMNEMEAWLWQLIQHDEGFEEELRETLKARAYLSATANLIKDILGEVK